MLRRGRAYLDARATCVYPIGVTDGDEIARLVEQMGGPVNVWLRAGSPPMATLRRLDVARISVGSGLQRRAMAYVAALAADLVAGGGDELRAG